MKNARLVAKKFQKIDLAWFFCESFATDTIDDFLTTGLEAIRRAF